MAFTRIDRADYNGKGVIGLPDAPQLSTNAMQEKFEEISLDVIIPKHNTLIDELESATGASNIGTRNGNVQSEIDAFDGKIATFNGDISQLKSDMTQAQGDIATLQSGVNTNKTDIAALQSDNTTNKADIATNKANITTLQNENTTNKANITKNANDISALQTSVTTNANNIASLQSDNTTNKADIASLKSDNVTLKGKAHMHANKSVIDALSKDSATGNLMFEGNPISGGGSGNTDTYGHVKVGSVTLDASGDDTIELVAGSNVTLTPNATNKSVTISASGGGGGTSTGDMLKSEFVLPGGTGQVLSAKEADHATNADNATSANSASTATIADKAMAVFDGTDEIPANQLMKKSDYDADDDGVVDLAKNANKALNANNAEVANNATHALMSEKAWGLESSDGTYSVSAKEANDMYDCFHKEGADLKLSDSALSSAATTKLSKVDNKIDKPTSATEGQVLTYRNNEWVADDLQGGGQFVIIAKGETYEGQTVTATKGTKSKSAVITSGIARIPVNEGGVWTLTLSSGETWNTPNMTYYGEYEVLLTLNGATVTPTDDVQTWLHCANIWDKQYTTVSQVVADKTTLNALVQNENANDYLVRSTTFSTTLCENNANNEAMYYLGLYNGCANKLLADDYWSNAICSADVLLADGQTHLFEKVLNVKVPTMTSNTAPSGEVTWGDAYESENSGLNVFNASQDDNWLSINAIPDNTWVGYRFTEDICVKKVYVKNCLNERYKIDKFIIYGSKTEEWNGVKLGEFNIDYVAGQELSVILNNNDKYLYYRIYVNPIRSSDGYIRCGLNTVQFYGRKEA